VTYIITISGIKFDLLNPTPEQIKLIDIAHSLSMTNRFNGHTQFPYSVAQHSLAVAEMVDAPYKLGALLHDAGEAYIGDIITPIKRLLPKAKEIENCILDVIFTKYGAIYTEEVSQVDQNMGLTEAIKLQFDAPRDCIPYNDYIFRERHWLDVCHEFINKFHDYSEGRYLEDA